MSVDSWHPYDLASEKYFRTYESLDFSKVHHSLLTHLPPKGSHCLDVGSGSGRDAAALARRGYLVTAVEPSTRLRKLAERHHRIRNIRWIDDHLPELLKLRRMRERYQLILLSAVWMHIAPEERRPAMAALAALLAPRGSLAITFRSGPEEEARALYHVDSEEIVRLATRHGLIAVERSPAGGDLLRRPDVSWRRLVFLKP